MLCKKAKKGATASPVGLQMQNGSQILDQNSNPLFAQKMSRPKKYTDPTIQELEVVSPEDVFLIVDVSDKSQSPSGSTKKVKAVNMAGGESASLTYEEYLALTGLDLTPKLDP